MSNIPRFGILLVCHNRRTLTLRALAALHAAAEKAGTTTSTVLFDDASTDGTAEAVRTAYPEILIVHGDGKAFWNRGLYLAWQAALPLPVDAFLWLNDDVTLDETALQNTASAWREAMEQRQDGQFILVGATRGADGAVSYGGKRLAASPFALRFQNVFPSGEFTPIDTFEGNFVVVPRTVVELIGVNDPAFFHNMGDIDYGLRARKAGVDIWLIPSIIGECPANAAKERTGYGSSELSLREQWRKVNSHHGLPFRSWARLTFRHSGIWFPLHFLLPYRHLLLSHNLFGRSSSRPSSVRDGKSE